MEPEPLKPAAGAPRPFTLGYAEAATDEPRRGRGVGTLVGYLFVMAFGLLLAGGTAGAFGDRLTGGTTALNVGGLTILGSVGLLFAWAGGLGVRYWYLRRTRRPLPPSSSPVTHAVRRLFHATWGGV